MKVIHERDEKEMEKKRERIQERDEKSVERREYGSAHDGI